MLTRLKRRRVGQAAEAAQQAAIPALANLSDDLLLDCCKLLPVMSLVSFSACSKNLRQVANHGSLWSQLSIPLDAAPELTDWSLAGLLQRVDAKNWCETISLTGCGRIDGSGLWPLQDSTVLRAIDLRRAEFSHGHVQSRPLAVSAERFLAKMIPHLTSVLVTDDDVVYNAHLRLTLAEAGLVVTASPCTMCHELVPASGQVQRWEEPLAQCGYCRRKFCLACEDTFIRDCAGCGLWRCNFCLKFEGVNDDEDEEYICEVCDQDENEGYGSDTSGG